MPAKKLLTKDMILMAQSHTMSNRACARALHVSYPTYRKYAKMYKDSETGQTLFEKHKNPSGKGIPKFLTNTKKKPALLDIIEGRIDPAHFDPKKIRFRLIEEGFLLEECYRCQFNERRVLDYKMPLLMNFKDKNKSNFGLENIELLCYNCYFLSVDDIFNATDIEKIESAQPKSNASELTDWEIDEYHKEKLKEIGLDLNDLNEEDEADIHKYISRI